jgi:hypothetical protein
MELHAFCAKHQNREFGPSYLQVRITPSLNPMGRFSMHPGERAIHSELVSILDIAAKVYDVMGVRKEVGDATAPRRQPRSAFPLQRSG